jgi:hypothetical protein
MHQIFFQVCLYFTGGFRSSHIKKDRNAKTNYYFRMINRGNTEAQTHKENMNKRRNTRTIIPCRGSCGGRLKNAMSVSRRKCFSHECGVQEGAAHISWVRSRPASPAMINNCYYTRRSITAFFCQTRRLDLKGILPLLDTHFSITLSGWKAENRTCCYVRTPALSHNCFFILCLIYFPYGIPERIDPIPDFFSLEEE